MAEGVQSLAEGVIASRHLASNAAVDQAKLAQRASGVVTVPLEEWRVWDALATNLPGTSASDDLGLITQTWGTSAPYIGTSDLKAAGSTTRRAACFVALPPDYEAGESVLFRAWAGMTTTVADTAATIDFEVYRIDKEDGTLGSADLVTTSATSINSLTEDDKDFTITAAELEPGDLLHVRMSVLVNDGGTGTAVIASVWETALVCTLR